MAALDRKLNRVVAVIMLFGLIAFAVLGELGREAFTNLEFQKADLHDLRQVEQTGSARSNQLAGVLQELQREGQPTRAVVRQVSELAVALRSKADKADVPRSEELSSMASRAATIAVEKAWEDSFATPGRVASDQLLVDVADVQQLRSELVVMWAAVERKPDRAEVPTLIQMEGHDEKVSSLWRTVGSVQDGVAAVHNDVQELERKVASEAHSADFCETLLELRATLRQLNASVSQKVELEQINALKLMPQLVDPSVHKGEGCHYSLANETAPDIHFPASGLGGHASASVRLPRLPSL